ncbi:hypothetical protein BV22DRAFT_30457 [Leucogyrophana mollusca]|uniref:Uncharacterized protein n=1 Tax=Leucogyrophana mollusca TaxID=85980 RepID=A0ACB8BZW4_9AGAM|nr:hypothetical protein BV22DRAFT_30457 [Leucogyrophana mollusca]
MNRSHSDDFLTATLQELLAAKNEIKDLRSNLSQSEVECTTLRLQVEGYEKNLEILRASQAKEKVDAAAQIEELNNNQETIARLEKEKEALCREKDATQRCQAELADRAEKNQNHAQSTIDQLRQERCVVLTVASCRRLRV